MLISRCRAFKNFLPIFSMTTDPTPNVTRVLRQARRQVSFFEDAATVWHSWGQGMPLMLLHGGSGSWTHWLRNIEMLAGSGYEVIIPDIPGFGDSDVATTGGEDAPGVIAPLWSGYTTLFGAQPCQIMGFSFGAMVAVLMAQSNPDLARHLLLVAPPGLGLRSPPFPIRSWKHLQNWDEIISVARHNLSLQMLHLPESLDDETLRIHVNNIDRDRMRKRKISQTNIVIDALPHIRCPVDAIYGDQDSFYLPGLSQLEGLLKTAPYFRELTFVQDCGHWVAHEGAETFNPVASRMLSSAAS